MESKEELHSFQFCEELAGIEHDFRITKKANHAFGIEEDGVVIAEVTNDCEWKQLSGPPINEVSFRKICDRIEDHYA